MNYFCFKGPKGEAPSFTSELKPTRATEGDSCKLSCKVSALPEPTIEWFKDDQPLGKENRIKPSFDGHSVTLLLKDVTPDDVGTYKCVARNSLGTVSSQAILKVDKKTSRPTIIKKLKDTKEVEGDEARFEIKVEGYPKPTVEWYLGPNPLFDGRKHKITESGQTYSMTILNLDESDIGLYKCVATNDEGKAESRANLDVEEKQFAPQIEDDTDTTKTVHLNEGDELNKTVKIRAVPKPEVTWYKDGKRLRDALHVELKPVGNSYNIYIGKSKLDDKGEYKCVATNVKGSTQKIFDVKVKGNQTVNKTLCGTVLVILIFAFFVLQRFQKEWLQSLSANCGQLMPLKVTNVR